MKRSLYLMVMFALSLALVLSACAPAAAPDLDGTEWQLVELNGSPLPVYVKIMLSFQDGLAGGQGACNGYGADYTQDGYTLALQPAMSTLMYCEGVMEYETSYLQAFNQVKSFQLENDQLSLLDENDNVLLVFGKPQAAPALDGTSWNATQVGDLPVPEGVTVSLNFAEGQLTGKAACNSYFAGYSQQEDRLTVENPGATEMYCEDEIRMGLERAFLDSLPKVRSFQIQMGGLVLLDETGMPLIYLRP